MDLNTGYLQIQITVLMALFFFFSFFLFYFSFLQSSLYEVQGKTLHKDRAFCEYAPAKKYFSVAYCIPYVPFKIGKKIKVQFSFNSDLFILHQITTVASRPYTLKPYNNVEKTPQQSDDLV